jgi:xanthine dehydrogenase accessory factor
MSAPLRRAPAAAPANDGAWLTPMAGHWVEAASAHLSRQVAVVRVTVVGSRGSAPREPGASMLVDLHGTIGTIGGGQLEWHASRAARELLCVRDAAPVRLEELVLGPQLRQCCGGRVELWLERLTVEDLPWLRRAARGLRGGGGAVIATTFEGGVASHRLQRAPPGAASLRLQRSATEGVTLFETLRPQRPPLWVFGAGHVGQALVRLLSELALFEITWVDPRPELLPADLPGVSTRVCAAPADLLRAARAGTRYVVLTHDHSLDYDLCRSILARGDSAWLGLIGSASKSARFRSRLLRDGVAGEALSALTCPIGIQGIASKLPAAIAIAIAAQLLRQTSAVSTIPCTEQRSSTGQLADARPRSSTEPLACTSACGSCGAERRQET